MKSLFSLILGCFLCLPVSVQAEMSSIGKVILVQGNPILQRADQHLSVKRNTRLFQGDRLIIPVGSKLLFRLNDKTTTTLAENSELVLHQYDMSVKDQGQIRFKMLKGAFRTLTGAIGKQPTPVFEVITPIATIGVRGTEFWGGMIFSEALDVTMLSGKGVYIENAQGRVEILKPGLGTTVQPGYAPAAVKAWPAEKLSAAEAATALQQAEPSDPFSY